MKKNTVKVTLTYEQIVLEYATQTDANLDRNGKRPDLIIAIYCAETGRELCLKSWKAQKKYHNNDYQQTEFD